MTYNIAATVKSDHEGTEKTYGTEIQVEGPCTVAEFTTELGEAGVLDVLVSDFKAVQAAKLRARINEKIGKGSGNSGGRLANAVLVDLEG